MIGIMALGHPLVEKDLIVYDSYTACFKFMMNFTRFYKVNYRFHKCGKQTIKKTLSRAFKEDEQVVLITPTKIKDHYPHLDYYVEKGCKVFNLSMSEVNHPQMGKSFVLPPDVIYKYVTPGLDKNYDIFFEDRQESSSMRAPLNKNHLTSTCKQVNLPHCRYAYINSLENYLTCLVNNVIPFVHAQRFDREYNFVELDDMSVRVMDSRHILENITYMNPRPQLRKDHLDILKEQAEESIELAAASRLTIKFKEWLLYGPNRDSS